MKFDHKTFLIVLLVIFVVFDIPYPPFLGKFINSYMGMFVVVVIALSLFSLGPLVGALGLIATYMLLSRRTSPTDVMKFIPNNEKKNVFFQNVKNNIFPKTLEEEFIKNMVPFVNDNYTESQYLPSANNIYDARKV